MSKEKRATIAKVALYWFPVTLAGCNQEKSNWEALQMSPFNKADKKKFIMAVSLQNV